MSSKLQTVQVVTSVSPFKTATMPAIELVPGMMPVTLADGTAAYASAREVVRHRPSRIRWEPLNERCRRLLGGWCDATADALGQSIEEAERNLRREESPWATLALFVLQTQLFLEFAPPADGTRPTLWRRQDVLQAVLAVTTSTSWEAALAIGRVGDVTEQEMRRMLSVAGHEKTRHLLATVGRLLADEFILEGA